MLEEEVVVLQQVGQRDLEEQVEAVLVNLEQEQQQQVQLILEVVVVAEEVIQLLQEQAAQE